MADLAALRSTPIVIAAAGLRLLPPMARYILRGDAGTIRAAGAAIGIDVVQAPCRASHHGSRALLWLGPDEYLLLGAQEEGTVLASALENALPGEPHSLV